MKRMVGVGLAACALLGCGASEEAPRPSGAPMASAASKERSETNEPPLITGVALEPEAPLAGKRVRAVVQAEDPDGDPLRFRYTWTLDGHELEQHGADFVLDQGVAKGARIEVSVVASDAHEESAPAQSWASVGNRPPELLAVALEPPTNLAVGAEVKALPEASDPDGDVLAYTYEWRVNGRPVDAHEASFSSAGLQRGDTLEAVVVASDGHEESRSVTSAPLRLGNAAPEITSQPSGGLDADGRFHYAVQAVDPDGDRTLRFKLLSGPEGMSVDPVVGEVSWKPGASQAGKHTAEVAVEDGVGGASSQRFEVNVSVVEEPATQGGEAGDEARPASPASAAEAADEDEDAEAEAEEEEEAE